MQRFSLSAVMVELAVFLFCTTMSLVIAKWFFALVDDFLRMGVYHGFAVVIVVTINPHNAINPFSRFMKEAIPTFSLQEWFSSLPMPSL